jgi:Protein of unknown function (DUF1501)
MRHNLSTFWPTDISRRRFVQGALVAGGLGLTLANILRLRANGATTGEGRRDTAVIQVWLGGGPSQFETFDPKPGAPVEIRGPYGAIRTRLPGVLFCETLPRLAAVANRTAILQTLTHGNNEHLSSALWCSTGVPSANGSILHPSSGSIAARFRGANRPGLPAYVQLSEEQTRNPEIGRVMGQGHLGRQYAPFTILQDPFVNEYQAHKVAASVANLRLADDVSLARNHCRSTLLADLDRIRRTADTLQEFDQFQQQALEMVASGAALRAFDLSLESTAVRRTPLGSNGAARAPVGRGRHDFHHPEHRARFSLLGLAPQHRGRPPTGRWLRRPQPGHEYFWTTPGPDALRSHRRPVPTWPRPESAPGRVG